MWYNYTIYSYSDLSKGEIDMKKLLSGILAGAMAICLSVNVIAASSSISIKNNVPGSKPVTYTYSSGKSGEIVKSVKTLMTKLSDLPRLSSVVQTLTVTSETEDNSKVNLKLRLSIPEKAVSTIKPETVKTPSPEEYSSLDYYNIVITDTKGNVIYSYEEDNKDEDNKTYKDIPLGVMNSEKNSENKIFNITVYVNKDLNKSSIRTNAEKLDWSIVSDTYTEEITATQAPNPVTAPEITVTASPEVQNPTSSVSEDKNGVITLSKGEYLCGRDIDKGRYTMTGTGKVHVYTSENVLKSTIALKDKDDKSSNGVDEYIINLSEGERIVVDAETKFTPYTASSRPTSTPRASSNPKSSSTSKPKATATPKPDGKNNPKTGDSAPLAGVTVLGLLAIGGFVFITIKKRKEN